MTYIPENCVQEEVKKNVAKSKSVPVNAEKMKLPSSQAIPALKKKNLHSTAFSNYFCRPALIHMFLFLPLLYTLSHTHTHTHADHPSFAVRVLVRCSTILEEPRMHGLESEDHIKILEKLVKRKEKTQTFFFQNVQRT